MMFIICYKCGRYFKKKKLLEKHKPKCKSKLSNIYILP